MKILDKNNELIKQLISKDWFAEEIIRDVRKRKMSIIFIVLTLLIVCSTLIIGAEMTIRHTNDASLVMSFTLLLCLFFLIFCWSLNENRKIFTKGEIKYLMDAINDLAEEKTYSVINITENELADVVTLYYKRENKLEALDFERIYYPVEKLMNSYKQGLVKLIIKPFYIIQQCGYYELEELSMFADIEICNGESVDTACPVTVEENPYYEQTEEVLKSITTVEVGQNKKTNKTNSSKGKTNTNEKVKKKTAEKVTKVDVETSKVVRKKETPKAKSTLKTTTNKNPKKGK